MLTYLQTLRYRFSFSCILCPLSAPCTRPPNLHRPRSAPGHRLKSFRRRCHCQDVSSAQAPDGCRCGARRQQSPCVSQTACWKRKASGSSSPPASGSADRLPPRRRWQRARRCFPQHTRCRDVFCFCPQPSTTCTRWPPRTLHRLDLFCFCGPGRSLWIYDYPICAEERLLASFKRHPQRRYQPPDQFVGSASRCTLS